MEFNIKGLTFCIKPSFIALFIIMIALLYTEQFFVLFVSVTLHEFGHILAARCFGLNASKIIFTPIGEIAVIKNIEILEGYKKCLVFLAGPCVNIIISVMAVFFAYDFEMVKNINLSIAIFNLLPIYPLDGGKLFQTFLCNNIGVLNANRIVIKASHYLSVILLLSGIVQMILYSYNISLLCIAIYLLRTNKKQHLVMAFEFYNSVMEKRRRQGEGKLLPVRHLLTSKETYVKNVIVKLCGDNYTVIYIHDDGCIKYIVTEAQLIDYIQVNGLNGTVNDIYRFAN